MKHKILLVLSVAVFLNGCTTENIKYANKEEKSMALMQQCKWDPELDRGSNKFKYPNKIKMYADIYNSNCAWFTSPEVANKFYKIGYNVRGFHPRKLKYLPK
jgi:hypothetical protein